MKKVLALTLVLVLALSMSTVAFAAVTKAASSKTSKGGDADGKSPFNYAQVISDSGSVITAYGNGRDTIKFPLKATYFVDNTTGNWIAPITGNVLNDNVIGTTGVTKDVVSRRFVTSNDVEVKIKWVKGSGVFDSADINNSGEVELKYKSAITSVKDIDYKYQVLIAIGGRTITDTDDTYLTIEGTYAPDDNDGGWADDWFRFEGRNYLKPDAYVRNMEYVLNAEEDVTIWGRALKGVKYYGYAKPDWTDADTNIAVDHPAIVGVYHIEQINLATVMDYVTFNNDDTSLFVYDKDLNLLGKVGDKITTFSPTYYLAASELDVEGATEPDEGDDGDEGYEPDNWDNNAEGGGDDLYPENPHDNPGTGK